MVNFGTENYKNVGSNPYKKQIAILTKKHTFQKQSLRKWWKSNIINFLTQISLHQ